MRTLNYELAADEAWTHLSVPPNRYWCFFGGIFGPESAVDRLESNLRNLIHAENRRSEIKWSAVSPGNLSFYQKVVEKFFDHIAQDNLIYRQIFLDRMVVRVPDPNEDPQSDLDVQYKIYYQFIKHQFGMKYLPTLDMSANHEVRIRLDEHSSQRHKQQLKKFVEGLPNVWPAARLKIKVTYINSKSLRRLQVCDLIMGAAGSHGNRMHCKRKPSQRGMTAKQKSRHEMAKYIYNRLREIDHDTRGSKAFNWFETTGKDGQWENRLHHKIRIHKFKPRRFKLDYGWQNKNLDKQGNYQGSQLSDEEFSAG